MDNSGSYLRTTKPGEGVFHLLPRLATRLHSVWLRNTWPFAQFGKKCFVHWSCDIARSVSGSISLGDETYLAPDVWLNVVPQAECTEPRIALGRGCKIGRRSTISSKNRIVLHENVLLGPSVLIMDHNHNFSDPTIPIVEQGVSEGGRITIEEGCWLGYGSAIVCGRGELILGRNSVVGANAVVTKSFPAFSVIAGNPARLIRSYDERREKWVRQSTGGCVGTDH